MMILAVLFKRNLWVLTFEKVLFDTLLIKLFPQCYKCIWSHFKGYCSLGSIFIAYYTYKTPLYSIVKIIGLWLD